MRDRSSKETRSSECLQGRENGFVATFPHSAPLYGAGLRKLRYDRETLFNRHLRWPRSPSTKRIDGQAISPPHAGIPNWRRQDALIFSAFDIGEGLRRAAWKMELDAAAARDFDPSTDFHTPDRLDFETDCVSLADSELEMLDCRILKDSEIAELPGARQYLGRTLHEVSATIRHGSELR